MTGGRPTRSTVGGRVYLDLRNLARRQGRPTDELLQLYALEGLLARLAASRYSSAFVLKGGVLLAALGARRPTRDIDVQARDLHVDTEESAATMREIAAVSIDDGLHFDADSVTARTIRDDDEYGSVRVVMTGSLATARLSVHIDISAGDPVVPPPGSIDQPRLLGGTITLLGYPLVMVHAEKIVTAMQRGTVNTRWRDFADIYTLDPYPPHRQRALGESDRRGRQLPRHRRHHAVDRTAQIRPDRPSTLVDLAPQATARWRAPRRLRRHPRSDRRLRRPRALGATRAATHMGPRRRALADNVTLTNRDVCHPGQQPDDQRVSDNTTVPATTPSGRPPIIAR